jgi:hypothetical protein
MEARLGNGAQSLPAYGISRWYKDANSRAEQVFEIGASIGEALCQMRTTGELQSTVRLIVMVTMKHDFKAPRRDTGAEIVDERLVLV